jgi:hypothetical protein
VQRQPPRPGDLAVEGVADQGVPEGQPPGVGLAHHAAADQLVGPLAEVRHGRHQLGVEHLPDHAGRQRRGARRLRQPGGPQQHGVADALGEGELLALHQLQTRRPLLEAPAGGQRQAELLDEEGDAVGPVDHRAAQRRRRRPQGPLQQGGAGLGVQRSDRDLPQLARPAQLAAHPPDRVGPGDLVAAVGPEQQQRLLLGRAGERRQQPQGGVVGLVQVVQEHRDRVAGGDARQGHADGLEQGGAVAAVAAGPSSGSSSARCRASGPRTGSSPRPERR